jgi:chromosome segregation ATPase
VCAAKQVELAKTEAAETIASANARLHTSDSALAALKLQKDSVDSALATLQVKTDELQKQYDECRSQKVAADEVSVDSKAQKLAAEEACAIANTHKQEADIAVTTSYGLRDAAQSTYTRSVDATIRIMLCDSTLLTLTCTFYILSTHVHTTHTHPPTRPSIITHTLRPLVCVQYSDV